MSTNDPNEPYNVFLSAASGNPGPSACAVLITRGKNQFDSVKVLPESDYDTALHAALTTALDLVVEKLERIVLVADRIEIVHAGDVRVGGIHESSSWSSVRSAWAAWLARRPTGAQPATIRWFDEENKEETACLDKVHRLAYVTAFPEGIWAPPYRPEKRSSKR